jgi:hypothetical protein
MSQDTRLGHASFPNKITPEKKGPAAESEEAPPASFSDIYMYFSLLDHQW